MKNIALLIAGGSGQRMHQDIPKQFINVLDKPVIVYTLEAFQKHSAIDAIVVVCIDGWYEILKAYAKQFNISKLIEIVPGGKNGQESIYNGLMKIKDLFDKSDNILIHDAIRPMISEDIISGNIVTCNEFGSAITAIPCTEAILKTNDKIIANGPYDRDKLMRTQTPQTFKLEKLLWAHEEAKKKKISNSVATCTLMAELGEDMHFTMGSEKNIKLTTPDDIEIFKFLLKTEKDDWIK